MVAGAVERLAGGLELLAGDRLLGGRHLMPGVGSELEQHVHRLGSYPGAPTLEAVEGGHIPHPRTPRWPIAVAIALVLAGVAVIALAVRGDEESATAAPPPIVRAGQATVPTADRTEATRARRSAAGRPAENRPAPASGATAKKKAARAAVPRTPALRLQDGWVESFYPIYAEAQRVYGVNWLLIASVHRQETAFSTHPTTYFGLNFARCCGGPMQFNVTNGDKKGRGSTWDRYRFSFRDGDRPEKYLSMRDKHPSIYDDFDAIMAGAHLLRDNGARLKLDASAWGAAYLYYGPDLNGVGYASQVVARAIGWAKDGFCAACEDSARLYSQVDAAWGAGLRAEMLAADAAAAKAERATGRKAAAERKR